jgi:hypothetical protein
VPVRLAAGDMRRWRLAAAPEIYSVMLLPDHDGQSLPGLAIVGANCERWLDAHSFLCHARQGAWVYVYHPQQADPAQESSGTLAVWRAARPSARDANASACSAPEPHTPAGWAILRDGGLASAKHDTFESMPWRFPSGSAMVCEGPHGVHNVRFYRRIDPD